MTIKIGTDPEFFLTMNDKFVSAAGHFPGTKKRPFPVIDGAVQVDGTALEFNIDAADTEDEFTHRIFGVLKQMADMIVKALPGADIALTPVARYTDEDWRKIPMSAKILGCDPDFDAWTGMVNPSPGDRILNVPLRTASGHIHIGWTNSQDVQDPWHFENCMKVAQTFAESGLFDPQTDRERERVQYYGMNGSFRPKSYGVELRAPSNLWLGSEKSIRDTYRNVHGIFNSISF